MQRSQVAETTATGGVDPALASAVLDTIAQPLLSLSMGRVVEFANPAFLEAFGVRAEETVGRPLGELGNGQWDIPELDGLLERVTLTGAEVRGFRVEHRFERLGKRVMLVSARRIFRAGRDDSILIAIEDVTEREALAAEVEGRAEFGDKLIDSLREALIVLRRDLTVHSANQAFYDHFRVRERETVGRPIFSLGNGQWDIPELRTLLENILPRASTFDDFEVDHEFPGLGRRAMLLNARRLDHMNLILLAIRDVTARRDTERQRAEREGRQALLLHLADVMRTEADPVALVAEATALLGRHLGAGQVAWLEIDREARTGTIHRDWNDGTIPSSLGIQRMDPADDVMSALGGGRTVVVSDVETEPMTGDPAIRDLCRAAGIGAFVNVPLLREGRLVAILAVRSARPRRWSDADVELVEEVAGRTGAAVERARSEADLAEAWALIDAIFEAAPVGIAVCGRDLRYLKVNPRLAEINGLPAEAHIGQRPQDLLTGIPDMEKLVATWASIIETGEPTLDVEVTGTTPADPNAPRTWLESFFPVRLGDSTIGVAAIVNDITERKQREEEVNLLLREVSHRSKNMLSLVQAIARQTARGESEFLRRFEERITALAAGQNLILGAAGGGVAMIDLSRGQLAHFGDLLGERIHLSGPPLRVTTEAAQTLGMAVHELGTNAGKYGALSGPAGEVFLSWRHEGDVVAIEWVERGGPPLEPSGHSGFGSFVTGRLVERTLGAEVETRLEAGGLEWRARCPAARVVDGGSD
jgi:PAS domain S-box-containing protein